MSFNAESVRTRIKADIEAASTAWEVVDYVRDMDLSNIPANKGYIANGVHVYIDIPNADTLTDTDKSESEQAHKRFLRFLDIAQRAMHFLMREGEVLKVDFQNQRLHAVLLKPYDDEAKRVQRAVAFASLVRSLLAAGNSMHDDLPNAKIKVGIESGKALLVSNGTRGDREPLFIGNAANQAAKLLRDESAIYVGPTARAALGSTWKVADASTVALTQAQVEECEKAAKLGVTADTCSKKWAEEKKGYKLAEFKFHQPLLPLKNMDWELLSVANSARIVTAFITADLDGFTNFVAGMLAAGKAVDAARAMHVLRKALRDTAIEMEGKKVRYEGDCLHAVVSVGEGRSIDPAKTLSWAVLLTGALHKTVDIAKAELRKSIPGVDALGLHCGVALGPVSLTRLGVKGSMSRVAVGTAVVSSQDAQRRAGQGQTAVGEVGRDEASVGVKKLFPGWRAASVSYAQVLEVLGECDDPAVKGLHKPSVAADVAPQRAYLP